MAPNSVSLDYIQNLSVSSIVINQDSGKNKLRLELLKEVAVGLGVRSGLASESEVVNNKLSKLENSLSTIYDFRRLLISSPVGKFKTVQYSVLPPIIEEASKLASIPQDDELRLTDKAYKIIAPAKFVSNPPDWKSYLSQGPYKVDYPDKALLPKNDEERKYWKEWVSKGWAIGIKQSDEIFDKGLSKLNRDYNGIILYRLLLKQNIVSAPYLDETRVAVSGSGNEMSLDNRVLKIKINSSLNNQTHDWNPSVIQKSTEIDGQ